MTSYYFHDMIRTLRQHEEVVLYCHLLSAGQEECDLLTAFLQKEYEREAASWPYHAPPFDPGSALWAARTVYIAAQLILYREHKPADFVSLFPDHDGAYTPSAILSADLCLRFLPDMIVQLKMIDSEDELATALEKILLRWHYSGVRYPLETDGLPMEMITTDNCLLQLYANRVITHKKIKLAQLPALRETIAASLGMYGREFWNDFKHETATHES